MGELWKAQVSTSNATPVYVPAQFPCEKRDDMPRQARDKRKESSIERTFYFAQCEERGSAAGQLAWSAMAAQEEQDGAPFVGAHQPSI